jgi:hypothetical protein
VQTASAAAPPFLPLPSLFLYIFFYDDRTWTLAGGRGRGAQSCRASLSNLGVWCLPFLTSELGKEAVDAHE